MSRTTRMLLASLALSLMMTSASHATVLLYNITKNDTNPYPTGTDAPDGTLLSGDYSTYGDNVSGTPQNVIIGSDTYSFHYTEGLGWTPNVSVSYNKGDADDLLYINDGGDWPGVLVPNIPNIGPGPVHDIVPSTFYIIFTPDVNYSVKVVSFDIRDYFGWTGENPANTGNPQPESVSWTLNADTIGGALLASGSDSVGESQPPVTLTTGAGFYQGTVVLAITLTNANRDDFAIDNVSFVQMLPEPASCSLLAIGGLLIGGRRRSRV